MIVTDPTPAVLGQELPALVHASYPSFKVFMTYDDLVLTDRQLLEVFTVARAGRFGSWFMPKATIRSSS
jgi:dihydropyrimidinase